MNFAAATVTFHVEAPIVVVGVNGEFADMDNPRGELFGYAFYVVAANPFGDTRVFLVGTSANTYPDSVEEAKANDLVARLTARAEGGKLPVAFDRCWLPGRAVYGSDAYVAYGQADDLAWEAQA